MKLFDTSGKNLRWLLLLTTCVFWGCASLPEQSGIWPWEYGRGQGEPNTGDYASFRKGVANFGEPPEPVKPIRLDAVKPLSHTAHSGAENISTKTEPPAVSGQRKDKPTGNKKNGYDFTVSESRFTAVSNPLLDPGSPIYDITASNNGNAPVSVAITIDQASAQNVSADKRLPYYAVVPANSERVLLRFSAKTKESGFNFRYGSVWRIGDYTATHNCPEQYRFPFGEKVRAFASVSSTSNDSPYTRHAVVFSLPKGTPVLAARKGTVIRINTEGKIDILHEDSTIGTYYHLERIAEHVVVGSTVTTDDIIGIAGTAENDKDAYMQLTVWRPEPAATDQLLASPKGIDLEAVSFPIPFSHSAVDKGTILTKNQPVSRGKLAASTKQAKRK